MKFIILAIALSAAYSIEWIPNNVTASASTTAPAPAPKPSTDTSPGEFPWQLSQ